MNTNNRNIGNECNSSFDDIEWIDMPGTPEDLWDDEVNPGVLAMLNELDDDLETA